MKIGIQWPLHQRGFTDFLSYSTVRYKFSNSLLQLKFSSICLRKYLFVHSLVFEVEWKFQWPKVLLISISILLPSPTRHLFSTFAFFPFLPQHFFVASYSFFSVSSSFQIFPDSLLFSSLLFLYLLTFSSFINFFIQHHCFVLTEHRVFWLTSFAILIFLIRH